MKPADTRPASASPGPLSRRVNVERLPGGRGEVRVVATPEECAALAAEFRIPGVRDLVGVFQIQGTTTRLTVTGHVTAQVTQTCGVSLEPFESALHEPVDVVYTDEPSDPGPEAENADVPDAIVNGRVDFGALAAEFLALGLAPYPRKPGITFEAEAARPAESPFDALRPLRDDET